MSNNNERSKALLSGALIYAVGNFGTRILLFLIVPLYTYYFAPSKLGEYDIVISTVNLLIPIVTLQISDAVYRWVIINYENSKVYIQAAYRAFLFNSAISTVLILVVNHFFAINYCGYFIVQLICTSAFVTIQKLLRAIKNQKLFVSSSILYTVLFLALNIVQICVLHFGVESLFISSIAGYGITFVYIFAREKKLRLFKLNRVEKQVYSDLLKLSIPLVPHQLNWWVMNSSDRYIILIFLGSAANGLYSITHKFPSLLQIVFAFFYNSWQDMVLSDRENAEEYYGKVFAMYYKIAFTSLLFITPATKVLIHLVMSSAYRGGANYVSLLYLGMVFQAFTGFYSVGYLKMKQTKGLAWASICGAIINTGTHILLVNFIGLYAASLSTFLGFLVMWLIQLKQTESVFKIRFEKKRFAFYFALALVTTVAVLVTNTCMDAALSAVGLVLFLVLNRKELGRIGGMLKERFVSSSKVRNDDGKSTTSRTT